MPGWPRFWLRQGLPFAGAFDLASGLVVTLADPVLGRQDRWLVQGRGAHVALRLQADGGGRFDWRSTRFGIYPRESWASAHPWPGDRGGIETVLRLTRLPPRPIAGLRWSAPGYETRRALSEQGSPGWEETLPVKLCIAAGQEDRLRLATGRLAVLPLEGSLQRPDGITPLHWLWFPRLGFGLPVGEGSSRWQVTAIAPVASPGAG